MKISYLIYRTPLKSASGTRAKRLLYNAGSTLRRFVF